MNKKTCKFNLTGNVSRLIREALREDIGRGDITSNICFKINFYVCARIVAKENGIISGCALVKEVFRLAGKKVKVKFSVNDGSKVRKGMTVARIQGPIKDILRGERTALNFLSHLSGISTLTRRFVDKVRPYKAVILDTRKTLPLLRVLEKHAVKCGGGINHRFGLYDQVLIKDNHLKNLKNLPPLEITRLSRRRDKRILVEIEVDSLKKLPAVLGVEPDIIMLDNMSTNTIKKAVDIVKRYKKSKRLRKPVLEVSGNVSLDNVTRIARCGVDRISIGSLTHSAPAVDFSLEVI